jgi:hypothetical protein
MQGGSMPKAGPLPSNQVQLFQAWINNGMPQSPTDPGGSSASGSSNTGTTNVGSSGTPTTSQPCTPVTGGSSTIGSTVGSTTVGSTTVGTNGVPPISGTPSGDPFDDLINPPAFTQCKAQGFVFDRTQSVCRQVKIATSYSCNDQGIIEAFQKAGVGIQGNLQQVESAGFQIDQCGELNGDPVVYFLMKDTSDPDAIKVQIKKLCKQGSPAC